MSKSVVDANVGAVACEKRGVQSHRVGWIAVTLGLAALICGVIPHFVLGEPLPNPFARPPVKADPANPNMPAQVIVKAELVLDRTDAALRRVDDVIDDAKETLSTAKESVAKASESASKALKSRTSEWTGKLRLTISGDHIPASEDPADALEAIAAARSSAEVLKTEEFPTVAPATVKAAAPVVAPVNPPLRGGLFLLAALGLAIATIPVALASWLYERQIALPMTAVGCGALAITWQYLVIGLMIGVAAAMFLIVLAALAQAVPAP
jgi:hypothetical protein